jgi:ribosomal protein S18 acetylase RimI-like enzyme
VPPTLRVAPLAPEHRARVAEIVTATGMFSDEEAAVAVELFDEWQRDEARGERHEARGGSDEVPAPAEAVASCLSSPTSYLFLGAFTPDGALIGFACHGPTPATDRTHDLYWIAVDPRAQGAGAGTRLLAAVERRLADDAARLLVVETSGREQYAPTRAFYLARGYTQAARVRDFYAPGDDRILFTKRLSPAAQFHEAPESPAAGGAAR